MTLFHARVRPSRLARVLAALALGGAVLAAQAQAVSVSAPWVRATAPEQRATGAFMTLQAPAGGRLVAVRSPVAGVVEIHEMTMAGDTMRMRAIEGLELPAGRAVELRPGGHHIMLMDLKRAIRAGETVPLTLVFERAGARTTLDITAAAQPLNAQPPAAKPAGQPQH